MLKLIKSKALVVGSMVILALSLLLSTTTIHSFQGIESDKDGNVDITEETTNLYTAGNSVGIKGYAKGDVTTAGRDIEILSEEVEGGVNAAGYSIKINSKVAGNVRLAGKTIEATGTFGQDILAFGQDVTIENVIVEGDLVVFARKLTLTNSTIKGDLKGSVEELDGDKEAQVIGKIEIKEGSIGGMWFEPEEIKDVASFFRIVVFAIPWEIGTIIFLIAISVFLSSRKRLEIDNIKLDNKFGFDLMKGFVTILAPIFLIIPAIFTLTYLQMVLATAIIYMLLALTGIFAPIYNANLIKNTFNLKTIKTGYLVAACYIGAILVGLIPVIGPLLLATLALANFGYLLDALFKRINKGLAKKK